MTNLRPIYCSVRRDVVSIVLGVENLRVAWMTEAFPAKSVTYGEVSGSRVGGVLPYVRFDESYADMLIRRGLMVTVPMAWKAGMLKQMRTVPGEIDKYYRFTISTDEANDEVAMMLRGVAASLTNIKKPRNTHVETVVTP